VFWSSRRRQTVVRVHGDQNAGLKQQPARGGGIRAGLRFNSGQQRDETLMMKKRSTPR